MKALTEQEIFNVKQEYAFGYGIQFVAQSHELTVEQVRYAINVNELEQIPFEL